MGASGDVRRFGVHAVKGDMAPQEPRFLFVHLQKTGGTALFQRLRDHFGARGVYPTPDEQGDVRAVTDLDFLVDRVPAHGDAIRVVTGHFPLCTTEVLDGDFKTFTVLRDPVERTLSLLRRRQAGDERFEGWALEDIYTDESLRPIIRNHMVKMLSLTKDELSSAPLVMEVDFDEARLERAKVNLRDQIDIFGLQEHFDEFCIDISSRFGWDLGTPRFANRTQRTPVSDGLREQIAEDNAVDRELYDFARQLWEQRQSSLARG
jgi:hypothetical protein